MPLSFKRWRPWADALVAPVCSELRSTEQGSDEGARQSREEGCFSSQEIDTSDETCYESAEDVPEPQWHVDAVIAEKADHDAGWLSPNSAIG